jgi:AcrR family transcriptional regulator
MGRVLTSRRPVRADSRNVVRGEQTRRRILDAARARILAESFEAMRLDDLATDVGVTKAAVIKSVGGKASMLLMLGEEDRQTRLEVIRDAMSLRSGLRRRLTDVVRRLLELDASRLNVVTAYVGYMWFWTGADHDRSHAMVDDTRSRLGDLIADASPTPVSPARQRVLSLRLLAAYAVGIRDLHFRKCPLEETVRLIVDMTLD